MAELVQNPEGGVEQNLYASTPQKNAILSKHLEHDDVEQNWQNKDMLKSLNPITIESDFLTTVGSCGENC